MPEKEKYTDEQIKQMHGYYKEHGIKETSKKFSINFMTLYRRFKALGLATNQKPRSKGATARQFKREHGQRVRRELHRQVRAAAVVAATATTTVDRNQFARWFAYGLEHKVNNKHLHEIAQRTLTMMGQIIAE